MAKLVYKIDGELQEVALEQELTIGRGYSNLLRLDGVEISRVHAIIYRMDDKFLLRDLDSKNGVFLNGLKISTAQLNARDEIRIGKYVLIFDPATPPAASPPAPSYARPREERVSASNNTDAEFTPSGDKFAASMVFSPPDPTQKKLPSNAALPRLGEEITFFTRAELLNLIDGSGSALPPAVVQLETAIMSAFVAQINQSSEESTFNFVEHLLSAIAETLDASSGAVILSDAAESRYSPLAIYPANADLAVNRIVMREAFSQRRALLCPLTSECGLFRESTTVTRDKITTILAVPITGGPGRTGVLYLDRKGDEAEPFLMTDLLAAARVSRIFEVHLHSAGHLAPAGEPV